MPCNQMRLTVMEFAMNAAQQKALPYVVKGFGWTMREFSEGFIVTDEWGNNLTIRNGSAEGEVGFAKSAVERLKQGMTHRIAKSKFAKAGFKVKKSFKQGVDQ